MAKTALLFPGQGSQYVGMGSAFYKDFPFAREVFDMAEEITRKPIKKLCFEGPLEELTVTANLQPAVTAVNMCASIALSREGIIPDYAAGHSVGEYSAFYSMGVLNDEDTFKLVNARGDLMDREANAHPGSMSALVGLDYDQVAGIVESVRGKGICSIANYNSPTQIVISGEKEPVEAAGVLAEAQGARAVPLPVSGAWHSELIVKARDDFKSFLDQAVFNAPKGTILLNVTGESEKDPGAIKEIMMGQICAPVQWCTIIQNMLDEGVEIFIEAGPRKVLTGLLRKIAPKGSPHKVFSVEDIDTLEKCLNKIRE